MLELSEAMLLWLFEDNLISGAQPGRGGAGAGTGVPAAAGAAGGAAGAAAAVGAGAGQTAARAAAAGPPRRPRSEHGAMLNFSCIVMQLWCQRQPTCYGAKLGARVKRCWLKQEPACCTCHSSAAGPLLGCLNAVTASKSGSHES